MPTTFSELLAPTRTEKRRGYYWTPCPADAGCCCSGVLEVTKGKKATRYLLVEVYPDAGFGSGRGFQLLKADGTLYSAFLADDQSRSTCDCPGHAYAAAEKADRRHGEKSETLGCVHLDALASLVWNGWLPESRTNPDADVGQTEQTDIIAEQDEAAADQPELCGFCGGTGHVPGPTHDRWGYELTPRNLTCEYCGGSGACAEGAKLLPHRRLAR